MCDVCGCAAPHDHLALTLDPRQSILAANNAEARHNRDHFEEYGVVVVNLMSSPGAGKTSLLEATIAALAGECRIAVIEGDLETENDAQRIRAQGVPAVQITTGTACHLDSAMIHRALDDLPLKKVDLLFIENVGNLVCPASFDLGQHVNVTLLSVPEGDDKPAKYPVIFRASQLVLLTKSDLLPHLPEFSPARVEESLRQLSTGAPLFTLSSRSGQGMEQWLDWLRDLLGKRL